MTFGIHARKVNALAGLAIAVLLAGPGYSPAAAVEAPAPGIQNRTIAYATYQLRWALYQTPNAKAECPDGLTGYGPREMFADKYPKLGSVADTQLATEAAVWFPQSREDNSPHREVKGSIGYGLNLDGKIGPEDFTNPNTGETGIDNELYRAIGCSAFFRGPDGNFFIFGNKFVQDDAFNRTMIEITNVDSLENDPDVDVGFYRGLDNLLFDATAEKTIPGSSQRVDARFGKVFERHFKGKIVDGVLITEPSEIYWPWSLTGNTARALRFNGVQFKLRLTPGSAEGFVGGYSNVDDWYNHLITFSTHHLSYGRLYAPALYRALHRLADAHPNTSGVNQDISWALDIKMGQVFVVHPPKRTAATQNRGNTVAPASR